MAISRQIFQQFLLDKPASPRSLSPQEEAELASEGLLEIANHKFLRKEAHLQGAARELSWRALLQELAGALATQRSQAIVFKGGAALGRQQQGRNAKQAQPTRHLQTQAEHGHAPKPEQIVIQEEPDGMAPRG